MHPLRLLVLTTLPLVAQESPLFRTWTLADPGTIEASIQQATERMSFLTRPIARNRLKKLNPAYGTLVLSQSATHWSFQFEQRKPVVLPRTGQAVAWTREDGETFQVNAALAQDTLEQHFQGQDGARRNRFRWDATSRTLVLEVEVTSSKLPEPVRYFLRYR